MPLVVDNEMILRTMRAMAWDRAKGELQSVLSTFWGSFNDDESQFAKMTAAVNEFIKHVEGDGLHE
jgi:cytochrome c peroxidase